MLFFAAQGDETAEQQIAAAEVIDLFCGSMIVKAPRGRRPVRHPAGIGGGFVIGVTGITPPPTASSGELKPWLEEKLDALCRSVGTRRVVLHHYMQCTAVL